jgi:hypothetical protein
MKEITKPNDFLLYLDSLFKEYKVSEVYTKHKFDNSVTNRTSIVFRCVMDEGFRVKGLARDVHEYEPTYHCHNVPKFGVSGRITKDMCAIYKNGKFFSNEDEWMIYERPSIEEREQYENTKRSVDKGRLEVLAKEIKRLNDCSESDLDTIEANIISMSLDVEEIKYKSRDLECLRKATRHSHHGVAGWTAFHVRGGNCKDRVLNLKRAAKYLWFALGGTYTKWSKL